MPQKVYRFFEDPGHGWIKVRIAELIRLNIMDKISPYSYFRAEHAYLEEDCDFEIFFKAKQEQDGIKIKWHTLHTDKSSKIRSYRSFAYVNQGKYMQTLNSLK